jgi:hypothetical protein
MYMPSLRLRADDGAQDRLCSDLIARRAALS